jgi:hypothetical protein
MFAWIFAAVALALAFAPPRIRKVGFAIVGTTFLIFLAVVLLNRRPLPAAPAPAIDRQAPTLPKSTKFDFDKYEQDKKDKDDPEAKTRIPVADVRFDQVQAIAGIDAGTIESVHARLYNDSARFTLTDYGYYLVVRDCLPAAAREKSAEPCPIVYDQRGTTSLAIPPHQARDVVIPIPRQASTFASPFKLLGTSRIELAPTMTRAYQPARPAS